MPAVSLDQFGPKVQGGGHELRTVSSAHSRCAAWSTGGSGQRPIVRLTRLTPVTVPVIVSAGRP
jgi:hypothetical protein